MDSPHSRPSSPARTVSRRASTFAPGDVAASMRRSINSAGGEGIGPAGAHAAAAAAAAAAGAVAPGAPAPRQVSPKLRDRSRSHSRSTTPQRWQDLAAGKLRDWFSHYEPLVAQVDERGVYKLQLPATSGLWHLTPRGLLTIRNVGADFPGVIIPCMPSGIEELNTTTYREEPDRPRLPHDLPVHAYVPMRREPPGLQRWIEK